MVILLFQIFICILQPLHLGVLCLWIRFLAGVAPFALNIALKVLLYSIILIPAYISLAAGCIYQGKLTAFLRKYWHILKLTYFEGILDIRSRRFCICRRIQHDYILFAALYLTERIDLPTSLFIDCQGILHLRAGSRQVHQHQGRLSVKPQPLYLLLLTGDFCHRKTFLELFFRNGSPQAEGMPV